MRSLARYLRLLLLISVPALAQGPAADQFRALHVDANKVTGELRSFQGMNGTPAPIMAGLPGLVRQYREMRVSQVRTHDVMGPTDVNAKYDYYNKALVWLIPDPAQRAGVVKAGNASIIFPHDSADPENPASYNFAATDNMLTAICASGAEVYYRIGRSWGANVEPPHDFDKLDRKSV